MKAAGVLVSVVLVLPFGQAFAVPPEELVFEKDAWKVTKSWDVLSDQMTCDGIYRDNRRIRIGAESLMLMLDARPERVSMRFGTDAARHEKRIDPIEKTMHMVNIDGENFASAMKNRRVRVEIETAKGERLKLNVDLRGAREVLEQLARNPACEERKPAAPAPAGG